jgi:hypothetical protein
MAKRMGLDGERLRELARLGAEVTLRRLRGEIVAIERAFPELKLPARRRQVRSAVGRVGPGRARCQPKHAGQCPSA